MFKITIPAHLNRCVTFYEKDSPKLPAALFDAHQSVEGLDKIPDPLPSRRRDYTCMAKGDNDVVWYGAPTGLTRFDPHAAFAEDRVMAFAPDRDLPDACIEALLADGDGVWVLTKTGAVHIEMKRMTAEEKANVLLAESVAYVDRRGMYSQKRLSRLRDRTSAVPFGHSDNDGCFTAGFAIGELYHYAVLKREKGADHPETRRIRQIATRASEACLLLMYVARRGNGFVARTYMTPTEPIPDDGLFYRMEGGKAVCLNTREARQRGIDGLVIDASAPIPARLQHLYRDTGCTEEGLIYKGDTSSDEITLHYLHLLTAHRLLAPDDPELGALIRDAAVNLTKHIIDHGYMLSECDGKPTTWAKWNRDYFESDFGWEDACLNAGELLFYLRVTMELDGDNPLWKEHYDRLVADGYPSLMLRHLDRFTHVSAAEHMDIAEFLMYGDNMLAVASLWGLSMLETDPDLLETYRKAFGTWRGTLGREHNPGYDFPYLLACPDAKIDEEKAAMWFRRFLPSRVASGVCLENRHDIPQRIRFGGGKETSALLPPDECFIAKYDRNPLAYRNEDSGGMRTVESCYVYTFAYWIGRYYGLIEEQEDNA